MRDLVKLFAAGLVGGFIAAALNGASALVTGTAPGTGPQLVDGTWLNALAAGNNNTYQSGISAAGTTSANGTLLNPNVMLNEIDTVGSGAGVVLPFAVAPDVLLIRNAGLNNLTVYANPATNPQTSAVDTVNGTTSITINTSGQKSALCFAAKNGAYSCMVGS